MGVLPVQEFTWVKISQFFSGGVDGSGQEGGIWKRGSVRRGLADIPQGRIYRTQQPVR